MTGGDHSRVLALVGLAALGVGLALIGTAAGVGDQIAGGDSGPTVAVSETDVTFSNGERTVTVVESMAGVERLEIAEEDPGRIEIRTESGDPLGDDERERAIEIARSNDTVQRYLERLADYEVAVEPVAEVDVSAGQSIDVSLNGTDPAGNGSNDQFTFTVEGTVEEDGGDSVSIARDPTYVEDEAVVRITAGGDVRYSIHVDLATETVVGITDWDDVRSDSRAADPDTRREIAAET